MKKQRNIRTRLNRAARLAVPALLFAHPGFASFRTVSRSISRIRPQSVTAVAKESSTVSATQENRTPKSPFAPYTTTTQKAGTASDNTVQNAISFLRQNDLLTPKATTAANISGDIRKDFAGATASCLIPINNGSFCNKSITNKTQCTSVYQGIFFSTNSSCKETDTTAPTGYSVSFDATVYGASDTAGFSFSGAEEDATYNYTITSSEGSTSVTGSGTVSTATQTISDINLSSLSDGTLTLTVTLTDEAGNEGEGVTATATLDTTAPAKPTSVEFNDTLYSNSEASTASFTIKGGNDTATYSYTISDGSTTIGPITGSSTNSDQIINVDISSLADGTVTLSVTLTDTAGNTSAPVEATATLDKTAPAAPSSVEFSTSEGYVNANATFTISGAEDGSTYNYTITSDGGGTNVTGTGTITNSSSQTINVDLSGLNDGTLTLSVTLTDTAGNTADAVTTTAILDTTAPSAPSAVTFNDSTYNKTEASSASFTISDGDDNATYSYTISSDGGGSIGPITGSASSAEQTINVDLSSLSDGTLTLSVTLTDTAGNTSTAATSTAASLDTTAPTGQTVSFDNTTFSTADADSAGFTISGGESGAAFNYTISSDGGGTNVTGTGTISNGSNQTVNGINLSSLNDGTLTLSVTLTDTAGNDATPVTATATLDTTAPTTPAISFSDTSFSASESSSASFNISGAEANSTYAFTFTDEKGNTITGSGTVTNSSSQTVGEIDLSSLTDGDLTLSVTLTDSAGNPSTAAISTAATLDTTVPAGQSVNFDKSTFNATDAESAGFTITDGESGATYSYSISSDNGEATVTGSGTISNSSSQTISGIDLSGLSDGTLTLLVTLTDSAGNAADAVTTTATLDTTAPSAPSAVTFSDSTYNKTEASSASFTISGGDDNATYSYTISSDGGGSIGPITGSASSAGQTVNVDLSGLDDGTLTLSVTLTDSAGNAATPVTATATLDTTAPTTPTITFSDTSFSASESSSASFTISGAETGSTYSYTFTDKDGKEVTGSGTIADNSSQTISDIDLSGLEEGALTLSVTLTDTAGNTSTAATSTAASLDKTVPTTPSITFGDDAFSSSESSSASFTISGAEEGSTYSYTFADKNGKEVTGSGTITDSTSQTVNGIDLSELADGSLTLSVTLTDTAGNTSTAATSTAASLDTTAPSGQSVNFDKSTFNATDAESAVFTISDGEYGATYSYTISSNGGGTDVTGAGTISDSTSQTVSGINLSGLNDGTLIISVVLTDTAGNAATPVTATATLKTTRPTVSDSNISVSGASGTGGVFKVGDTITATWNNSASGDNNSDAISSVTVNFDAFGGGSAVPASNSGDIWTAAYTVTEGAGGGIEAGNLNILVTATNTTGNSRTTADSTNCTLDNITPAAPSTPDLADSSDDGIAMTDDSTSIATPTFTGTAEVNTKIVLTSNIDGEIGTTTTDSYRIWTITASNLSYTTHSIAATATDAAGNVSSASSSLSVLINHNPEFTGTPVITGTAEIGETLGLENTEATDADGDTVSLYYQWLKNGYSIAAATEATYTLTSSDRGVNISCLLSAQDQNGGEGTFTTEGIQLEGGKDFPWELFVPAFTHPRREE